MAHSNTCLYSFTISKCRAFFKSYAKSIGILLTLFSFFAHAATENQIKQIQLAAEEHILANVEQPPGGELSVSAANIDSRIKATDCPVALSTSANSDNANRSNINVLVECPSDDWQVYVPVRLSIAIPMVVATRTLARGEIISLGDVKHEMIELQRFRKEGFADSSQVVGAKVKRTVRLGNVIERGDVCVVCRNEKVIIKASQDGMVITTLGTALQDGAAGEQVRVKNDKSQRIIEGIVSGIAEVTVQF
ncbi:flagella basal body P-ring formation protein FlgA [Vibrio navarrensis]|uniref:Flagella basal body P-ring formation protein FlgA n=1 Tax=Vibrio navarrensis TaxID=29495 RepID=A0AAJ4ICN9_9VIBR|nr:MULTISPECIES: flagellar basal body P-ring formation chaperone FlgA [Vibrio]KJR32516.1 flagellar basal body P-ring biosynthesis protein FlgA [Vibrio sp. S234-5]MBE3654779.1 flagella basal body P-ring formation protein FlgA [Vibrio navarrensis]MBE3663059.1 flagella basal body P-ring formation protein FlgA [Vibrio navarrensis]MBE4605720.1 flagella basal body P-ring formation protein FlgA [Vibrio navarrensis]QPL54290.1 flagellar basal body P-ring formation protein FlgA [Vibrio navarrensis]